MTTEGFPTGDCDTMDQLLRILFYIWVFLLAREESLPHSWSIFGIKHLKIHRSPGYEV